MVRRYFGLVRAPLLRTDTDTFWLLLSVCRLSPAVCRLALHSSGSGMSARVCPLWRSSRFRDLRVKFGIEARKTEIDDECTMAIVQVNAVDFSNWSVSFRKGGFVFSSTASRSREKIKKRSEDVARSDCRW